MNQLLKKKQNQLSAKKGFTLVELIIVIAIIAILAAIAIPKFGSIKSDANAKANLATAKNIATIVSKELADDKIAPTTAKSLITAIPAAKSGDPDIDITEQIDGNSTPRGGTTFKVETIDGNVKVYIDDQNVPIYPQ